MVAIAVREQERWHVGWGCWVCFFFQAEDGIRDWSVTGVQTCALPIFERLLRDPAHVLEVARPQAGHGQQAAAERLAGVVQPDERVEVVARRARPGAGGDRESVVEGKGGRVGGGGGGRGKQDTGEESGR